MGIESFPRMWDQHMLPYPFHCIHRIIPTYVGSTHLPQTRARKNPNHSHVCGINFLVCPILMSVIESFPRMWDQLVENILAADVSRIIPTYVGSTFFVGSVFKFDANHSHVCGINGPSTGKRSPFNESFPRMWDQHRSQSQSPLRMRIIPTYVGSTSAACTGALSLTNHSHVCGINYSFFITSITAFESFPRMWDQLADSKT